MPSLGKAVAFTLSLAAAACATNPATGKRELSLMSEEEELRIGQEQDVQTRRQMGVYDDRALQQYVDGIGRQLAQSSERPALPWHFTVVDVPAINAFALPGGYIYVTRGILPFLDSDAQLAGVLGHEIGHVTARHGASQYSRSTVGGIGLLVGSLFVPQARPLAALGENGLGVLFLKYGRGDELEADALGVRYVSRAGWDPAGIPQMLTTLGRIDEATDNKGVPNWLQTHPQPEDRVQRVQTAVRDAEAGARRFNADRDGYATHVNGIVFGDNPDQGVVRGASFLHRQLRFGVEFPSGWDVRNGQTQVVASEPGAKSFVLLMPERRPVGRTVEDIASRFMTDAGFRELNGGRTSLGTLDAYVGTYQGTLPDLGRVGIRAAHIILERDVYLLAGIASADTFDRLEPLFSKAINSFHPLTRGEAESVQPNRIGLYTAKPGDTWQSIAERNSHGTAKATTLAIMNGHAVNEQPRVGERLKIVIG